ncbi:myelin-associated glycoprotein-like isoform X2 [Carcharodon carcharias]|uniref:myelin-associated glycoprotein-like isoform X2 n=1 Tax=Carcharodon carcharias TaxID=13397 RepID=UPI001B7D9685|nr:myelin-associated glycoprotein-like isoform X2 [Carcharodon carcharias]
MGEVGLILIFISLLQGVTSEGWSMKALPRRAISSSCVVILCSFDFPSHSYTALHGAWFKYWYRWKYTIAYTKDPNYAMATFVGRAKIIGDLERKNCSLRIDSLRAEDSDVYYFYVDAEGYIDHTFTEPVQLQILDAPDKPVIVLLKDLQEGTPAHIICKCLYTCPDNHPNLTWSELLTSSVSTITENGGDVSALLTFNPSFKHHGRTLRCTCDYPQTSHRVVNSVTLSVKYSPHNTSVSMTLEKGKVISLSCSSDGNPAVHNFTWFKTCQGKVTNLALAGQTITVPYGFEEEISYYCEATSILGSSQSLPIRIPTEYTPQNLSITSLDMINASWINIIEGNSAVIVCYVESFPASNLTWRHLNVPMNRTSSNNELWLVIPHVTSRDTGDYQCVAENEHGAVEGFITIAVEHAPQNLSITSLDMINASSINIIEGNSAVIICSVESFPASNLTWQHLNVPMNKTSSNNELWLVIPHITSRDTGDYQCVAENEHGAVEGFITITVERRDSNEWKAGLLGAGICLSVGLSGFFIFMCVRKGSSTGRGHSAQAERMGSSPPGEQSDRYWKKDEKDLEMKSIRGLNPDTDDDLYANCDFAEYSVYGNL